MTATRSQSEGSALASIDVLLDELRARRPVIVVDDEDRENEGDLIMPAEVVTPELMAFTIRYTGGVVCVAMNDVLADHLELPPMVERNDAPRQTAFTVTIDASRGIGTGISAHDRAVTVAATARPDVGPGDLVRPGHVFPLRAREGGVLSRPGHTEATVDLCRLAGFRPVGALSELMNEDGSMMRLPRLLEFAAVHGLKVGTIADLIAYSARRNRFVRPVASPELKSFQRHGFTDELGGCEHVAFTLGAIPDEQPWLVRIHTECGRPHTDLAAPCRCTALRHAATARMVSEGRGVLVCLSDTPRARDAAGEATQSRARPDRNYAAAAQILQHLGIGQLRLLTNDPLEGSALAAFGARVAECIPL